mmetsp:Transcript_41507/g.93652  ORF Transcript_41507/g.93652 Transcript_41507/m.93652 type:complete len:391 (+) Transcript_41507:72-1244(+)
MEVVDDVLDFWRDMVNVKCCNQVRWKSVALFMVPCVPCLEDCNLNEHEVVDIIPPDNHLAWDVRSSGTRPALVVYTEAFQPPSSLSPRPGQQMSPRLGPFERIPSAQLDPSDAGSGAKPPSFAGTGLPSSSSSGSGIRVTKDFSLWPFSGQSAGHLITQPGLCHGTRPPPPRNSLMSATSSLQLSSESSWLSSAFPLRPNFAQLPKVGEHSPDLFGEDGIDALPGGEDEAPWNPLSKALVFSAFPDTSPPPAPLVPEQALVVKALSGGSSSSSHAVVTDRSWSRDSRQSQLSHASEAGRSDTPRSSTSHQSALKPQQERPGMPKRERGRVRIRESLNEVQWTAPEWVLNGQSAPFEDTHPGGPHQPARGPSPGRASKDKDILWHLLPGSH